MTEPQTPGFTDRDELLLALGRGDLQGWSLPDDYDRHTAEVMYGKQADAILASDWLAQVRREAGAQALRDAAELLEPYSGSADRLAEGGDDR